MLNKRNDCVDKKCLHSLDVHHVVDMLSLSGRLSHGDVEGLLQAGHDLVNESIVVWLGNRRIVWDVNIGQDPMDVNADFVPILSAAKDADHRDLEGWMLEGLSWGLRSTDLLDITATELGHTRIEGIDLNMNENVICERSTR